MDKVSSHKKPGISEISREGLPGLNLLETLVNAAFLLMDESDVQMCTISTWDEQKEIAISLIDIVQATWDSLSGERYSLKDFPTGTKVLTTGEIAIVHVDMDDPETDWMKKDGFTSAMILPLYKKGKIIGIAEVASTGDSLRVTQKGLLDCERFLQETGEWLISPLQNNPPLKLLSLAKEFLDVTGADSCSLSTWLPDEEEGVVVAEFSLIQRAYEEGLVHRLAGWPSAKDVLFNKMPIVNTCSSPDIDAIARGQLEEYSSKTQIIIPLTVGDRAVGFIELYDIYSERSVSENELYSWGYLSGQVALAIQNIQLLQLTVQKMNDLLALHNASKLISSSLDHDLILSRLMEQICNAVDGTSAYILEFQSNLEQSKVIAEYISTQASYEEKASDLGEINSHIQEKELIQKLQRGQHDYVALDSPEISDENISHMEKFGAKSILFIPLKVKDQLIGYTEIWESRKIRDFTSSEIDLCHNISAQAAVALENAGLYSQIKNSLAEKEVLLQEVHHRVKNNLQIISSLLNLQAAQTENQEVHRIIDENQDRVLAMGLVHEMLYKVPELETINFYEFVEELSHRLMISAHADTDKISVEIISGDMHLKLNTAITFGLLLNELITNSIKYAFPGERKGKIRISLSSDKNDIVLFKFSDNGVGFPEGFDIADTHTFGLELVRTLVNQLEGELEIRTKKGVEYRIKFHQ